MTIPYLSYDDVMACARLDELVALMTECLGDMDQKSISIPEKSLIYRDDPRSIFMSMPALYHRKGLYLNKVGTFFERSPRDPRPTIHAMVITYSSQDGTPLAILDGVALTNIKCAAISAMVTNLCATPQANTLAIIGAGVQARQQLAAACLVRNIREIRLFNRSDDSRHRFIKEIEAAYPSLTIVEGRNVEETIDDADIVATTTSANRPLSSFAALGPTVHVNCMGAHTAASREIPIDVLQQATLIVEDVPTAIREAGPVHADAVDLATLLRRHPETFQKCRTIFSSTGYALLDAITVDHVIQNHELKHS